MVKIIFCKNYVRESTVVRETPALLEMENEIDFEDPPPGGSIKIFFSISAIWK